MPFSTTDVYARGVTDPRRQVPRTDALLADPRLAAASLRLGRDWVKSAVVAAQQAARAGRIAPADVSRLAELGKEGMLLLCGDSTNADRPGVAPSESSVGQARRCARHARWRTAGIG